MADYCNPTDNKNQSKIWYLFFKVQISRFALLPNVPLVPEVGAPNCSIAWLPGIESTEGTWRCHIFHRHNASWQMHTSYHNFSHLRSQSQKNFGKAGQLLAELPLCIVMRDELQLQRLTVSSRSLRLPKNEERCKSTNWIKLTHCCECLHVKTSNIVTGVLTPWKDWNFPRQSRPPNVPKLPPNQCHCSGLWHRHFFVGLVFPLHLLVHLTSHQQRWKKLKPNSNQPHTFMLPFGVGIFFASI